MNFGGWSLWQGFTLIFCISIVFFLIIKSSKKKKKYK